MGASVKIEGEIRIDPPVPWSRIKDSEYLRTQNIMEAVFGGAHDLMLHVVEEPEDIDEGTLIRRHVDAIVPAGHGETNAYHLEEEIDAMLAEIGPGHTFTGRLDMSCPDYETQWRIKVVDGAAVRFDPEIVWPEASE